MVRGYLKVELVYRLVGELRLSNIIQSPRARLKLRKVYNVDLGNIDLGGS